MARSLSSRVPWPRRDARLRYRIISPWAAVPQRLRVGLNLGDVIVGQDGDLYGDGISIAVRLEGVADPGGILISEKVYGEVEGKLDVGLEDRGEQQLKHISKPVRAYAVSTGPRSALTERLSSAPA